MDRITFINQFKNRTKKAAAEIVTFYDTLKKDDSTRILGKQLLRSATPTAANYRAACIARSDREFYAKMSIVVEEADETVFWLELFEETQKVDKLILEPLMKESIEILKIVSAVRKNSKQKT